uniref:Tripartite motif-containing protein 16-like n=2 Tax=Gasterosteus aculeatus TaxID=69293 RepID=A0AAQ4Q9W1_GASAC|nr:E3 ubiquitin/ISG15 ligase TRIM25-like [Gasterosteus aculeatus aculeatus]
MAQQGIQLDQEKLCCAVCLDVLKEPVTLPCGHSYCMSCIENIWGHGDQKETHSCPQCRQTFGPRPSLVKNTMLTDLVEELKKKGLAAAAADACYAALEDVACDFCTGRKLKALKSCLQCLVSYCEHHLQPHYQVDQFKKHVLVDPSGKLQENICTRHNEVLKIFCRTDQQCVCILCSMDEHKGHDTVSAAAEMAERQKELGETRQRIQQRIQRGERDKKVLQQEVEAINRCADEAVRDSEKIFTDARQQIRSRQKSEVSDVNALQGRLRQEISDLRGKDAELELLSRTGDHTRFLQSYASLKSLGEAKESPGAGIRFQRYGEEVAAAVSEVRGQLQDLLSEERSSISLEGTEEVLRPQAEPETRADFLKYSSTLQLDPSSAHRCVRVNSRQEAQFYYHNCYCSPHPDRFTDWHQVLCREGLTGRCYWEVECVNLAGGDIFVAVAYKSMNRSGVQSAFGSDNSSWALQCFHSGYEFRHNNVRTSIPGPLTSTVGVYLDHSAGTLSFYSVSETMRLLHRVQTTFTQPLCPGLGVHETGGSVKIS